MSLALHLVRKDARRLARPYAVWLVLFALAPAALVLLGRTDLAPDFLPALPLLGALYSIALFAGALLVLQLGLEDPLQNPHAPWRTRPISRALLLRAKLLATALLFVAAPLAVLVPVWLLAGFTAPDLARVAATQTALHALGSLLALAVAALSQNLARAALWLVVAVLLSVVRLFLPVIDPAQRVPFAILSGAFAACALALAYLAPRVTPLARLFLLASLAALTAPLLTKPRLSSPVCAFPLPAMPVALDAEHRDGSTRHRIAQLVTTVPRDPLPASPAIARLRLRQAQFRQLGPVLPIPPASPDSSPYLITTPADAAPHGPLRATALVAEARAAGLRLVVRTVAFPATDADQATWSLVP